jgi:hypothetical protein
MPSIDTFDSGVPRQRALDVDPARDDVQRAEQRQEGQVVEARLAQRVPGRRALAREQPHDRAATEEQADERLVAPRLPPAAGRERQERDGQQEQREGRDRGQREVCAQATLDRSGRRRAFHLRAKVGRPRGP